GINKLTLPVAGIYSLNAYANISGYPNVNALVGARFKINNTVFSPRTTVSKSNAAMDSGHLIAVGTFAAAAGDFLQPIIASSHAGNFTIRNFVITFNLIRET